MKALIKNGELVKANASRSDGIFTDAEGKPTTGSLSHTPTTAEYEAVGLYDVIPTPKPTGDNVTELPPVLVNGRPEQRWLVTEFTPDELAAYLTIRRGRLAIEINDLIVKRAGARLEAFGNVVALSVLVELWPMLSQGAATADILACHNIYSYGKTKMVALGSATRVEIDSYDPATDSFFPS